MYSLYKTDKKIEPFIDTGAYIAPRRLKVKFYPFSGIIYQFYLYRFTSFNFKAFRGHPVTRLLIQG